MTDAPTRIVAIASVTDPAKVRVVLVQPDTFQSVPLSNAGLPTLAGDNVFTGDNTIPGYLPLSGGTLSGTLVVPLVQTPAIQFPASQVVSADPNTIDDHERGVFTPRIDGSTTAGLGTYSQQTGRYTKIGNLVFLDISITWSAHTGTGSILIVGLPFTPASGTNPPVAVLTANLTFTGQVVGRWNGGTTQAQVISLTSAGSAASIAMDTAASVTMAGSYVVA